MQTQKMDVRPLLSQGKDPLDEIMAAWTALPAGEALAVCAPFQPQPLMALFSAQGVAVQCRQQGPGEHWLLIGPKPC